MISELKNQFFENYRKMHAFLAIYEFKIAGIIPAYHSEVIVGRYSFGYGDEGLEITQGGIMDGQYGYKLITSIPLGNTEKTQRELREIMRRLDNEWPTEDYHLFYRNCRHFSLTLINELECDSSAEGKRILAGLIKFSETIGWICTIISTGLIHIMPLNPLTFVSRPMEILNQGRILDLEPDFKIQLLQMLMLLNSSWIIFLLIFAWFSRSENEEHEMINQFENMEL